MEGGEVVNWKHVLWLAWLSALAIGGEPAAVFGARGSWYQGAAIGTVVGLATWFSRPPWRRSR